MEGKGRGEEEEEAWKRERGKEGKTLITASNYFLRKLHKEEQKGKGEGRADVTGEVRDWWDGDRRE